MCMYCTRIAIYTYACTYKCNINAIYTYICIHIFIYKWQVTWDACGLK